MPTQITINVTNLTSSLQNFYFFQQPAIYAGGPQVYTNSLYSAPLLPNSSSGSSLSFSLQLQYYAGVQQQVSPPQVGSPSGQIAAIQAIGLTPAAGGTPTNNLTNMIITPSLGLTAPTTGVGVQPGAFRIVTPQFNPSLTPYNAGSAVKSLAGQVTLSNFVAAPPNANLDCQPILKFYVATGTYTPGTVMDFTASSAQAALCDATQGFTTFNVTYNADGSWSVIPLAAVQSESGGYRLLGAAEAQNVQIYNEAGRAVICTGYAANAAWPLAVANLGNPGALAVNSEYQVSVNGGGRVGCSCTALNGANATFAQ